MLKQCVINKIMSQKSCIFLPSAWPLPSRKAVTTSLSSEPSTGWAQGCVGSRNLLGFLTTCTNQSGLKHLLFSPEFLGKNWLTAPFCILNLLIITSFIPFISAIKSSCQAKHAQSKWPCVLVCVYHISIREFHFQHTRLHNPLALEIGPGLWIYWSRAPRNKNMSIQPD